MGKINKGILGGVSGKVGNVVGSNWKGIDYLRVLPAGGNSSTSQLQTTQRFKFSTVLKFLQPLTEFLRIGFKGMAVKQTAFNAAMSYNYHTALTGVFPDFTIDYSAARVSQGNLPGAVNPVTTSTETAKVVISWGQNTGQGMASATDTAMVAVYNTMLAEAVYLLNGGTREDGVLTIEVPASWSGNDVHCYLSFMAIGSAVGGQFRNAVSTSVYAGMVTVA